jgi:hypothetical protein
MGVNKWDLIYLTTETVIVIALKHVAVVVLVDVIAAAIADVIVDVATASSEDSVENPTKDMVAKRNVTPAVTMVSLAGLMGSLACNR